MFQAAGHFVIACGEPVLAGRWSEAESTIEEALAAESRNLRLAKETL
jgi:hypothetical protein